MIRFGGECGSGTRLKCLNWDAWQKLTRLNRIGAARLCANPRTRDSSSGHECWTSNSSAGSKGGIGTLMILKFPTARCTQPGGIITVVIGFKG